MAAPSFHYEPLTNPRRQIRLLTIKSSRDNDSVLAGSMSCHALPSSNSSKTARLRGHISLPSYFALSYLWGSGLELEKTHEIILDGRRFPVTAKIHGALLAARNSSENSFKVWIDAVSIDQANQDERSAQIPLMPDIYSMSMITVIWLDVATDQLMRVGRFIFTLVNDPWINSIIEQGVQRNEVYTKRKSAHQKRGNFVEILNTEMERAITKSLYVGVVPVVRGARVGVEFYLSANQDDTAEEDYPKARSFICGGGETQDGEEEERKDLEKMCSWQPKPENLQLAKKEDFNELARLIEESFVSGTKYFDRMWTLQEACVSVFPEIYAGCYGVPIEDVLRTACFLNRELGADVISTDKVMELQRLITA